MPVPNIPNIVQYTALANQVTYSYNFYCRQSADMIVYLTRMGNTPNDATDILPTNQFTFAPNLNLVGGTITIVGGALPVNAGDIVTLQRNAADVRPGSAFSTAGPFSADAVNLEWDNDVQLLQQNYFTTTNYTLRYNYSSIGLSAAPSIRNTILPILQPLQTFRMNAAGTGFEGVTTANAITQINTAGLATGGPITSGTGTITVPKATLVQAKDDTNDAVSLTPFSITGSGHAVQYFLNIGNAISRSSGLTLTRLGVGFYQVSVTGQVTGHASCVANIEVGTLITDITNASQRLRVVRTNAFTYGIPFYILDDTGSRRDINFSVFVNISISGYDSTLA